MQSLKNFVELRFDELIDSINDIKMEVITRLDEKMSVSLEDLAVESKNYENRIEYFDAVLSQVKQIQAESQSADEDLLGFFFANQQRIEGIIQGEGVKGDMNQFIEKFEKTESNIYNLLSDEMKSAYYQLDKV
jgi:hypothetical protein